MSPSITGNKGQLVPLRITLTKEQGSPTTSRVRGRFQNKCDTRVPSTCRVQSDAASFRVSTTIDGTHDTKGPSSKAWYREVNQGHFAQKELNTIITTPRRTLS